MIEYMYKCAEFFKRTLYKNINDEREQNYELSAYR